MATPLRSRRPPILLALATLLAAAIACGPATGGALAHQSVERPDVGDSYEPVRGLGPTKRASRGLLRVKLRDDSTVVTHGLDPQPDAPERVVDFAGPERAPVCASDYYQHVLYGYPSGAPNRIASVKATLQAEIRRMNALLNEEGLASGGKTADYKVLCGEGGEVRVDVFQNTQSDQATNFSGVVSAARDAGHDARNADYTIFFDSSTPNACGTGTYSDDQRLAADNANNAGGDYAVVYSDCWTDRTAMHENGHNQGAVQYDAPFSTGTGGHCNDGYDIMCYSDGGDRDVGMSTFCEDKMRFDCRHDTYFDTAPAAGSYLATNWNLGSPLNRFIAFDHGGDRDAACQDRIDNDGDGRTDYPADTGCASATDADETDPAACVDLRDNDGDGRTDYPIDPGCSSPLDGDESDPPRAVPVPVAVPVQVPVDAGEPPTARRLPTLTMATARKYARQRVRRKSPRAKSIRASCARRNRTSATCKVRWMTGKRAGYRGKMLVKYRFRGSRVALVATSSLRRIR